MPYVLALGLTLLAEVPLYAAVLTRIGHTPLRRTLPAAVLVNLVTHPPLWWFLTAAAGNVPAPYPLLFALGEALVCVTEALLLRRLLHLPGPLAYATALTANAASVVTGLLVAM